MDLLVIIVLCRGSMINKNAWSMLEQKKFDMILFYHNSKHLLILFRCSTHEAGTEKILQGLQTFASVCGRLSLTQHRDAFISCICKSSLPLNYHAGKLHQVLAKPTSNSHTPNGSPKCEADKKIVVRH